ncbi:MAG: COX15/CtaA family protein [Dehalococcoidia bacterium]
MKRAQQLATITVFLTVILIGVGVFVRASGSGLGCPDWPTCHGDFIPPNQKHALIEVSHRIVASVVGLLVIANAVLAWKYYRHVPFILWLATVIPPLVGFQGILGAITVVRELPAEIVATHLVVAMVVLSAEIALAIAMYREDPERREKYAAANPVARPLGRLAIIAIVWLIATFWIGGYMAESGAATACDQWPTCVNGNIFPGADEHEAVHMAHRYLAGGFVLFLIPVTMAALRRKGDISWAGPLGIAMAALWVVQVAVGALNVIYVFPDMLTVSHTVIASLIWGTLTTMIALAYYVVDDPVPVGRQAPPRRVLA